MKKYAASKSFCVVHDYVEATCGESDCVTYYLASDVDALIAEHDARSKRYMDALDARDARIAELQSLLRRVIEWEPALPVEASLADEIGKALGL